jgi:hypothetical protein
MFQAMVGPSSSAQLVSDSADGPSFVPKMVIVSVELAVAPFSSVLW